MPAATKAQAAILRLIDRTFQCVAFGVLAGGVIDEDLPAFPANVFQRKTVTSAMQPPKIGP
jgi:hypothetical protein